MIFVRALFGILVMADLAGASPISVGAKVESLPRTVLAFYNSKDEPEIRLTRIHRVVEMPLNHLGLIVRYRDINSGLPSLREMEPVLGIVTWFLSDAMPDPEAFIHWTASAVNSGKKLVVMGDLGLSRNYQGRQTALTSINHFLSTIGLRNEWNWTRITYDAQFVYKDRQMVEFERPLTGVLPPFYVIKKVDPRAKSYLVLRRGNYPETESHLVVVSPNGGYVADGYTIYRSPETHRMQLYLNPFEFFRLVFGLDHIPQPDTTTLSGRRIYYSHLDGDGWRNLTEINPFRKSGNLAARVILEKVIKAYPDLPFTVAPIVADIDPAWHGNERSLSAAREILAQPNTEAGSHTYSHPLNWDFFTRGDAAAEKQLVRSAMFRLTSNRTASEVAMHGHELPRSYYLRPFQLGTEIGGSAAFINALLPPGKKVETLQWSGDTLPYEAAVSAAYNAGLRNINGGDTRLDQEYPSYAWVAPLGRQVGEHWQIYASNSNENTYTDMWTDRYFGFQDLVKTIGNTEQPRRIKPFNVYFHMYSGQKLASLKALLMNLEYARGAELTPVTTSQYCAIAEGFYSAQIFKLSDQLWRIENRGALQTFRLDEAGLQTIDFEKSRGVIGQRIFQGSLYIALDAGEPEAVIALKTRNSRDLPKAATPYLSHSRWRVWNVHAEKGGVSFAASGFGRGEMVWSLPLGGRYRLTATSGSHPLFHAEIMVSADGLLRATLPVATAKTVQVTIEPAGERK
jgi:polysaccharide biosynthesis protein PelA